METLLVGLGSLLAGAAIKTLFDRYHVSWVKRREVAAEAYAAAIAVHAVVVSELDLARRVFAALQAHPDQIHDIAHSSDWYLGGHLDTSRARLDRLRDAKLSVRSTWGANVAALFDEYFDVTSAWHNAFGSFRSDIHGAVDPNEGVWDPDLTGLNWHDVIHGTQPHAELFEVQELGLLEFIRRFARSVGVAITDLMELPPGAREVIVAYEEHREQRQLLLSRNAELLPP